MYIQELRITEETTRLDNYVFNPDAVLKRPKRSTQSTNSCAGETSQSHKLDQGGKK